MKKGHGIELKIVEQGAAIVNGGYIVELAENVAAVEIDLSTKYCEVGFTINKHDRGCGIAIKANERSRHLLEGKTIDELTVVEFPEFNGWGIFCCSIARYTLSICFVKKEVIRGK